jgi:hypothetical protein
MRKILSLILILFLYNSCKQNVAVLNTNINDYVLEIGKYNLTLEELNKRIEKINYLKNISGNPDENFKIAWDASVKIGLIIADAYNSNLDTTVKLNSLEIRDKLIYSLSLPPKNIYEKISNNTIENAWSRRNRFYKIGHIIIDKKDKERTKDLFKEIRNDNMYFEKQLVDYTDIDGVQFIKHLNLYNITGGDLLPKIEEKVFEMKIGESISVTTQNHIHLIRLFGIIERKQEPLNMINVEMIKNKIAKNIMLEETNATQSINILCKEKFIDDVIIKDDEVIATKNGKNFTVQKIKKIHKSILTDFAKINKSLQNHKTLNKIDFLLKYDEIKKHGSEDVLLRELTKMNEQAMFLEYYMKNVSTLDPHSRTKFEYEKLIDNQINVMNEAKLKYILEHLIEKYEPKINEELLRKAGYPINSVEIKDL